MQPAPGLAVADERRKDPGADPGWSDIWLFNFATSGAELGGYVCLTLLPHQRTCWYWAWVVGAGRQPVMVVDNDVPLPAGRSLELRTEGLWADHTVEVPFDHVTLGCEAFALRLDDADDALAANPVGDRIPFGLDLEWDTTDLVQPVDQPPGQTGYTVPCRVHGEVLVADEHITLDATGHRHHTWGTPNWSTPWTTAHATLTDGTSFHVSSPGTTSITSVDLAGRHLTIEPVVEAPVLVPTSDGRHSRFVRALCRVDGDESSSHAGAGWTEHNDPT